VPGVSGYERVTSSTADVGNNDQVVTLSATCPSPKRVIGGGHSAALIAGSTSTALMILTSAPNATNTGWQIQARNHNDNATFRVTAYAICANAS
jgi:hypothetical protein